MQLNRQNRLILLLEIIIPITLLVLGIYHGLLQTLYRAGFIKAASFLGLEYYQGLTLHGVINAIVLTTFFAVAFGHAVVIYYLKKEVSVALNWLSFGLMTVGTLMASYAILSGNASVLYTFYAPMKASPFFYLGAVLLVVGSWVAFFSWIPLYLQWRRENKGKKTPIGVVGIMTTFIVWFMCTIPIAVQILFFMLPWSMGIVAEINVLLTRTLFWFFGHALVYFWLLPVYTMYYAMLPAEAGGKLYSDFAGRLVFMMFIILSIPVGVHHQFSEAGIGRDIKLFQGFLTFGIAIPSFMTAFTLAASMEYAGWKRGATGLFDWMGKLPWFNRDRFLFAYFICGLLIFIFGGITGIVNSSYNMNLVVHNTGFIPGHFHLTVGGPVFLGIIGMSMHLLFKLTGKEIQSKGWNVAVPYLWLIGLMFFSSGLMFGGLMGEPRRTNMGMTYLNPDSPLYNPLWLISTYTTVIGGIIMTISMLAYFWVFFRTLFSKKVTEPALEFLDAEPLHDEINIKVVDRFTPWIIAAIIIIVIAYTPPIIDSVKNSTGNSPRYSPENPVPEKPIPTLP